MWRATIALCVMVLQITSQSSYATDSLPQSSSPTWTKGDSWTVRCPDLSGSPVTDTWQKVSEYNVRITVLGTKKSVSGFECYVLEIRPGDDLPEHIKKNSDLNIEHVFYAMDTLELKQIEVWKLETDGTETKMGREVSSSRNPLPEEYYGKNGSWIPLLLPMFPLVDGSFRQHQAECKGSKLSAEKGEDVAISFSQDIEVAPASGKDALIPGSTKVTLYATTTYSKSRDRKEKKMEQVWAKGKKWWSVARLYVGPREVIEFTTVE